jgi:hypothetical protein
MNGGSIMTTIQIKVPNWLDYIFTFPLLTYRLLRFGYSFRRIPLGESKYTIVDPQDFYRFNIFNWCLRETETNTYAIRQISCPKNKARIVSLHREIMNNPDGLLVDHANGDGLDNRRTNLRLATHSQNQFNKRKTKSKTSSRFIGVYFEKRKNRWMARIHYHGKRIWLGSFKSESDAALAYDKAALEYHKEFARLNFPERSAGPRI